MDIIEELQKFESVVIKAAEMAAKMQGTAKHHNKFNTGMGNVDIVTEADLAVQEFLLQELAKTPLVDCKLLAEEDTPTVSKFTGKLNYYLAIDPIDGTAIYARALPHFSTIISVHDGKKPIYTFKYFPVLNWTQKIVKGKYQSLGTEPGITLPEGSDKKIAYYGSFEKEKTPNKSIPELYQQLLDQGFKFAKVSDLNNNIDGTSMYTLGRVAGFYCQDSNVYDALVNLHYAQAAGKKIYSGGPDGFLNLSNIQKRTSGFYYPGYYVVLN